jgi:uncharacterized protein (TIGR00304 family)
MNYITIGITLIILGFLVLIIGSLLNLGEGEVKGGGVILIGPIPIGFGTDRTSMIIVLVLAIILMLIAYAAMSRLH